MVTYWPPDKPDISNGSIESFLVLCPTSSLELSDVMIRNDVSQPVRQHRNNYLFLSRDMWDTLGHTGTHWDQIIQPVNTEKFNLGRTSVFWLADVSGVAPPGLGRSWKPLRFVITWRSVQSSPVVQNAEFYSVKPPSNASQPLLEEHNGSLEMNFCFKTTIKYKF